MYYTGNENNVEPVSDAETSAVFDRSGDLESQPLLDSGGGAMLVPDAEAGVQATLSQSLEDAVAAAEETRQGLKNSTFKRLFSGVPKQVVPRDRAKTKTSQQLALRRKKRAVAQSIQQDLHRSTDSALGKLIGFSSVPKSPVSSQTVGSTDPLVDQVLPSVLQGNQAPVVAASTSRGDEAGPSGSTDSAQKEVEGDGEDADVDAASSSSEDGDPPLDPRDLEDKDYVPGKGKRKMSVPPRTAPTLSARPGEPPAKVHFYAIRKVMK